MHDISASVQPYVNFNSENLQNLKNSLVAKRTIDGGTLGRPVDSWVGFGDRAPMFQQHWFGFLDSGVLHIMTAVIQWLEFEELVMNTWVFPSYKLRCLKPGNFFSDSIFIPQLWVCKFVDDKAVNDDGFWQIGSIISMAWCKTAITPLLTHSLFENVICLVRAILLRPGYVDVSCPCSPGNEISCCLAWQLLIMAAPGKN